MTRLLSLSLHLSLALVAAGLLAATPADAGLFRKHRGSHGSSGSFGSFGSGGSYGSYGSAGSYGSYGSYGSAGSYAVSDSCGSCGGSVSYGSYGSTGSYGSYGSAGSYGSYGSYGSTGSSGTSYGSTGSVGGYGAGSYGSAGSYGGGVVAPAAPMYHGSVSTPSFDHVASRADNKALFVLNVPAEAVVYFAGQKMDNEGSRRTFVSPTLKTGKVYSYDIKVVVDGETVAGKQKIRGGDRIELDVQMDGEALVMQQADGQDDLLELKIADAEAGNKVALN